MNRNETIQVARTLLLAAFAMVLEQNPLLAATDSGEDSMIGVCEVRSNDHKAEEARKGRKRPRIKSVHLNTFSGS